MNAARSEGPILDATVELLAESGVDGVCVDAVAARAGVGKQTIYRHWGSRAALIHDAVSRVAGPLDEVDTGSAEGDLAILLERLDRFLSHPATGRIFPSLIDAATRDDELRALKAKQASANRRVFEAALTRGVERGEIAEDLDLDAAVDLIAGPVFHRRLVARRSTDPDALDHHLRLVMRALRPISRSDR